KALPASGECRARPSAKSWNGPRRSARRAARRKCIASLSAPWSSAPCGNSALWGAQIRKAESVAQRHFLGKCPFPDRRSLVSVRSEFHVLLVTLQSALQGFGFDVVLERPLLLRAARQLSIGQKFTEIPCLFAKPRRQRGAGCDLAI